jgi:hypothetical protein
MSDTDRPDLKELLARPREALDIEIKEWLDLTDNNQRALLAKAIIAIANHGGGYVVIGLQESTEGQFSPAPDRPRDLAAFKQDNIQSSIDKYVDPPFQCQVQHIEHPGGHGSFPVVSVPGGHRTPIRAKVRSPDGKVEQDRVYIRRPGPKSEQPQSSVEWDQLFEKCLRARRDELLDGIRDLLAGRQMEKRTDSDQKMKKLDDFRKQSETRWKKRIESIAEGSPPTFPHGYYAVTAILENGIEGQSLGDFNETLQRAIRNHSGWPPFTYIHREVYKPAPVEGAIEAWFGPDEDGNFDVPACSDFWRASPNGRFYTRKGFDEDGRYQNMDPGAHFDISSPCRRIGEILLQIYYIATAMGAEDSDASFFIEWRGLKDRTLVSVGNPRRSLFRGEYYKCQQESYEVTINQKISSIGNALPEIVFEILEPLYALFGFFRMPRNIVEEELADLRRHSF